MKKVVKKAALGSKMDSKPKVKTVDRGTLPNVDVKSNPILNLRYKPSDKDLKIDTTSKKKMGGKMSKKK